MLGCFHLTGIVTMKTAGKTFARANIAASSFLTSQNTTVEHSDRDISGRQDLNLRPVAAATALHECTEIVATASGFVIKFSLDRFTTGCETFAVTQDPGNAVLGCFHLTGIVTMKTAGKTFARAYIAASSFLTSQNITVEHSDRDISGRQDLNLRPRGPKPRALPS